MALDTREKRAGVPGVARPWSRGKLPSSRLDEQWRISTGNGYCTLTQSAPAATDNRTIRVALGNRVIRSAATDRTLTVE